MEVFFRLRQKDMKNIYSYLNAVLIRATFRENVLSFERQF